MDFKDLVYKRRSNRTLTGGDIPREDVRLILEAGLRAPNACNYQSWHLYCITDKAKVSGLVPDICPQEWIKNASIAVVITEDTTRLRDRWGKDKADLFVAEDAGACAENMLLMAAELGYAGVFVGAFDEEKCKKYVGTGENERPVLIVPIGTYDIEPPLRDRKAFEDVVTFID